MQIIIFINEREENEVKRLRGTKEKVLGFALALVMVVSVFASANMFEVKAEASSKTIIDSVVLEFDWSKFESSEITFDYDGGEFWVTMTGTGVVQTDDPYRYLLVKSTQAHVDAGYITSETLANVGSDGWTPIWNYSEEYVIGADDVVGYFLRLSAEEEYDFSETTRVELKDDNMVLESMSVENNPTYGEEDNNGYLSLTINLGTGADIEEAINPSTQEPTTPPTTDGEVVFTDETADAILEASEIIVNAKCENVWESTEDDPYAYPVYVKTNEDGSKDYELGNSDDAEAYIRIDFTYTMQDGTELTWLENYTDAAHPNSMYDISHPIVLKDAEGNIYVKQFTQGMPEGSFDETIGVVPKEIYDGYMDWLIGKLKEEVSDTTTNDHKAQLENESDVKTKIELTEDEKSAIASGEELEVVLVFTDAGTKVDNDEKKAIEKQLGDNSLGVFLDIELIKKIGSTEVEVSETTGLITITFEMPEELKNKDNSVVRTYKVMRYHDGKVDVLDAKYDAKTGKLSFETDKFSTYAVVYSDAKVSNTTAPAPQTSAPKTGDTTNTFVYIALLCFAICSVVVVLRKQRKF